MIKNEILSIHKGKTSGDIRFPVLDLSFTVFSGELDLIICKNWDTKNTIVRILSGKEALVSGIVLLTGENLTLKSPQPLNIPQGKIIYLELKTPFNEYLSISDNLFLNDKTVFTTNSNQKMLYQKTKNLLDYFKLQIEPSVPVRKLHYIDRIKLEMVRHYLNHVQLIVMDEPIKHLKPDELEDIFTFIEKLRATGLSFLFISSLDYHAFTHPDRFNWIVDIRHSQTKTTFSGTEAAVKRFYQARDQKTRDLQSNNTLKTTNSSKVFFECNIFSKRFSPIKFKAEKGQLYQLVFENMRKLDYFQNVLCGKHKHFDGKMSINGGNYNPTTALMSISQRVLYIDPNEFKSQLFEKMTVYDNIVIPTGKNCWDLRYTQQYHRHIQMIFYNLFHHEINLDLKLEELSTVMQQKVLYTKIFFLSPQLLLIRNPFSLANDDMIQTSMTMLHQFLDISTTIFILANNKTSLLEIPTFYF